MRPEEFPTIQLLDHGYLRLVDHMGSDLSVVRAARVSYAAEWRSGEDEKSDAKLIRYLMRNEHTSPFEAVQFTFEIMCPIYIARQWHRHRTWAYNEVSARYTALPETFYVPSIDAIGVQSTENKQASTMDLSLTKTLGFDVEIAAEAYKKKSREVERYRRTCQASFATYRDLLEAGWPRERARGVLPVGTYTHFFGSVSLLNLFRFMSLRSHSHAQYEIRVYSEAAFRLARTVAVVSCDAFRASVQEHWAQHGKKPATGAAGITGAIGPTGHGCDGAVGMPAFPRKEQG